MESWEKINAVQRMQDYIEDNIQSTMTLKDIAKASGYSQWYAARMFKELIGKTPFDYVRALRLSKAAVELRDYPVKVIDVAFDFVFDSHEGFTRAFTKAFGVSPKKYSHEPGCIPLFMPYRIRDNYLRLQKGVTNMLDNKGTKTVFVQVVDRPARKLILKRGIRATHYFEYCDEVGCHVWGMLSSVKEALYEPVGMWLPDRLIKEGTSKYVQGVEVPLDYGGQIPDGYEILDLDPCKMMVFQGEPYEDDHFEETIENMWQVMDTYKPEVYGFRWAYDKAPRFQLEPQGYRGYIEARPVEEL